MVWMGLIRGVNHSNDTSYRTKRKTNGLALLSPFLSFYRDIQHLRCEWLKFLFFFAYFCCFFIIMHSRWSGYKKLKSRYHFWRGKCCKWWQFEKKRITHTWSLFSFFFSFDEVFNGNRCESKEGKKLKFNSFIHAFIQWSVQWYLIHSSVQFEMRTQ